MSATHDSEIGRKITGAPRWKDGLIRSWSPNNLQYILHLHEGRCCSGGLAKEVLGSCPMRPAERLGRGLEGRGFEPRRAGVSSFFPVFAFSYVGNLNFSQIRVSHVNQIDQIGKH